MVKATICRANRVVESLNLVAYPFAENLALRLQLLVLKRPQKCPRLRGCDCPLTLSGPSNWSVEGALSSWNPMGEFNLRIKLSGVRKVLPIVLAFGVCFFILACGTGPMDSMADQSQGSADARVSASPIEPNYGNMFNQDPGWVGVNNRERNCFTTTQNYGYFDGRIGGIFSRTLRQGYYGDPQIGQLTFDNKLYMSGTFQLTGVNGGGLFIGFFNSAEQGWRPPNFLGLLLDERDCSGCVRVLPGYQTSHYEMGPQLDEASTWDWPTFPITSVNSTTPTRFTMDYDPANNAITVTINGVMKTAPMRPEDRLRGAQMNRFGVFHVGRAGRVATNISVFFDDLTYTTSAGLRYRDFAVDPNWEGKGNRASYEDCGRSQDFGYENGRIGGLTFKIDADEVTPYRPHYYADIVDVGLNQRLDARGVIEFAMGQADGSVCFGWFSDEFDATYGAGTRDFIGVTVEGPSKHGHYFLPSYVVDRRVLRYPDAGPRLFPLGRRQVWSFHYDPAGAGGNGMMYIDLDGEKLEFPLPTGAKTLAGRLNRFGMLPWHNKGGSGMKVYLDNLSYTGGLFPPR
jgi:hypothetical protein